jgi:hypothetical protein
MPQGRFSKQQGLIELADRRQGDLAFEEHAEQNRLDARAALEKRNQSQIYSGAFGFYCAK